MIISASYKTDIPAFYGEWFIRRLRAGYCKMVNPYNRQVLTVSLTPGDVDGFIFWTKNVGPFLPCLTEVRERGYPFVVQYSINGYPRSLEPAVAEILRTAQHMHELSADYGSHAAVWRYDPILITSETPFDFHRRNFATLAKLLEGSTNEVVISFAQMYRKTQRNLERTATTAGFSWCDPADEAKRVFVAELTAVATAHGMRLTICSQRQYLCGGAMDAQCVDASRLAMVAGRSIRAPLKGNRPDCGCFASRDIGEYDTCPHGCVYCYAVIDQRRAHERYHSHDPADEFLFRPRSQGATNAPVEG